MPLNVFVLGLDDHNREILEASTAAEECRFHPLLTIDELQYGEEIPVVELLDKAKRQLDEFTGSVDALIGFWDFPVSTMVPLLCRYSGTSCPSLEAVVKCEHKYWARLEQQKVIDEYPAFGLVDPDHDQRPPAAVDFPMWVKPVKAFSSDLAFGVRDPGEFQDALAEIQDGIGRVGAPFQVILDKLDLPPEIVEPGGRACVAEETMSGEQVTLEGYVYEGRVHIFGAVDTINLTEVPSQDRFQYPSSLPARAVERMSEIARRIVEQVGLDMTTFNIEFFYRRDTDTIRVLEVNPRHSQSHAQLFEQVDGAANHQVMIQLALGRDPVNSSRTGPYAVAAKWFLRRFADGVVRRVPTGQEVDAVQREVPGVTVDVIVNEGDRLSELPDQDSYSYKIANLYIGADHEAELNDKHDRVVQALHFDIDETLAPRPS